MNHTTMQTLPCRFPLSFLLLFAFAFFFSSCSESEEEESEFANWQERNDSYFSDIYNRAVANSSGEWKVFTQWSLNEEMVTSADDHIVVQVLQEGTGSGCPLYTDSVRIHYAGSLIPSRSYSDGYTFDKSWTGDTFVTAVAKPYTAKVSDFVDGFSTALQHMHIGDHWRVYIPYKLGYDDSASGSIPAYSTLVFDLILVAYNRPGAGAVSW